jgi:hypothetical protein
MISPFDTVTVPALVALSAAVGRAQPDGTFSATSPPASTPQTAAV